jgi:hypothetical protein
MNAQTTKLRTSQRGPKMSETALVAAILQLLTLRRISAYRQNQGALRVPREGRKDRVVRFAAVDGISDIVGIYRGRYLAIEAKVYPNRPTVDQTLFLERVRAEDGIAILAYSTDDVITALAAVDAGARD